MKKLCAALVLVFVCVCVYSLSPAFDLNAGGYFSYASVDYSKTSSFKHETDLNQNPEAKSRGFALGGMMQLGLGLEFDNSIVSGFTLLAEGGAGFGSCSGTDIKGETKTESGTRFLAYGGFVSELLFLNGYINPGIAVNWDYFGFSVKPTLSMLVTKSTKLGIGVPIYIKDGTYTGMGVSVSISARGRAAADILEGIFGFFSK